MKQEMYRPSQLLNSDVLFNYYFIVSCISQGHELYCGSIGNCYQVLILILFKYDYILLASLSLLQCSIKWWALCRVIFFRIRRKPSFNNTD